MAEMMLHLTVKSTWEYQQEKRDISRKEVGKVLAQNDKIEEYPKDSPFPAALFIGRVRSRVLHVVAAIDGGRKEVHVVSAYEPDDVHFGKDKRTRRKKR